MILLFSYRWLSWIFDQTEFYQTEALQSDHAACEIEIHGCRVLRG